MLKVSVIIPVYNVEEYVGQCLRSVLQQTYRPLECIVVDDGGSDGSMEVVRRMAGQYEGDIQLKLLSHAQNRGLSAARNTGFDAATGDYVLFIDSDDWLPSADSIALLAAQVQAWPEVQMVQGHILCEDRRKYVDVSSRIFSQYPFDRLLSNQEVRNCFFGSWECYGLPVWSWNKLLSRRFLLEHNFRFEEGLLHEDMPYMHRLVCLLDRVALVKQDTYVYRLREGSITTLQQRVRYESWNRIITNIVSHLEADDYERQFYFYFRLFMTRFMNVPDRKLWRSTYRLFLRESWNRRYFDLLGLLLFSTCIFSVGKGKRFVPQLLKNMLRRKGIS